MSRALREPAAPLAIDVDSPSPPDDVRLHLLREVLQNFGHARLRVQGTSMLPTLWPGQVVEVRWVDQAALRVGDVVLLERGRRLFCHRLLRWVERDGTNFLCTRGDHLSGADPLFLPECLLGRVEMPPRTLLARGAAPILRGLASVCPRAVAWLLRRQAVKEVEG